MLKFFRKDYAAQFMVIVLMIVTAWIPAFINAPHDLSVSGNAAPLYIAVARIFSFAPWIMTAIVFLVFSFSVFFLNSILNANQISSRNSTIGAMSVIVCVANATISVEAYPFFLACPLILVSLQTLYVLSLTDKPESYLFNIGFFLSLASLLYLPSMVLILWALLTMMTLGYKKIRFYVIPILGFLTPYFIIMAICYFSRDLLELFELYSNGFLGLEFQNSTLNYQEIVVLAIELILLLLSIFTISSSNVDKSIQKRKRVGITAHLLFFSVLMMMLQKTTMSNGMIFITLSVFYTMALSSLRKSLIADILIIMMMIGSFVIQYSPKVL